MFAIDETILESVIGGVGATVEANVLLIATIISIPLCFYIATEIFYLFRRI